jgi:hypothetical protein
VTASHRAALHDLPYFPGPERWAATFARPSSAPPGGDGAVAAQAPDRACEFYERALRLWRGDVVADIDCLRQHPVVVHLGRLRSDVVLRCADAPASVGDHSRAMRHLLDACRDEPLSEVLHARLIGAMGSSGRRSEAVRVFDGLQDRLGIELGIGPSEPLWKAYSQAVGL